MDRRDSMKSLLVGSLAGGFVLKGCAPATTDSDQQIPAAAEKYYGRTSDEIVLDGKLLGEHFFTVHELETIATLCDLILPATTSAGSAVEAGVPEFIEFMAKDMPDHQLPLRGGIMWLDSRSNKKFNRLFKICSPEQYKELLDEIAFPKNDSEKLTPGEQFFSLIRDLTLTGYYTTKIGIDDLGFKGNQPNVWDGVPEEVLKDHDVSYDEEWLAKCLDVSKRNDTAQWDEDGNLMT